MCEISEIPKTWWTPTHDTSEPGGKMAVAPCVVSTSRRSVERGWRSKRWLSTIRHTHLYRTGAFMLLFLSLPSFCWEIILRPIQSFGCKSKKHWWQNSYSSGPLTQIRIQHGHDCLIWLISFNWFEVTKLPAVHPPKNKQGTPTNWWFLFEVFPVPRGRRFQKTSRSLSAWMLLFFRFLFCEADTWASGSNYLGGGLKHFLFTPLPGEMIQFWFGKPLTVTWIPAHVLEHLPCKLISHQLATLHQTTWTDIFCNRIADKIAKQTCKTNKHANLIEFHQLCEKIGKWQHWLASLNAKISELNQTEYSTQDKPQTKDKLENRPGSIIQPGQLTIAHPTQYFEAALPKWLWNPIERVVWKTEAQCDFQVTYAAISQADWNTAIEFFQFIQWHCDDSFSTSFIELAYLFWDEGFKFQDCNSPAKVATMIRKCANQFNKGENNHQLLPGAISSKAKSNGKTFPAGLIIGAYPKIKSNTLKKIAIAFFHGRTQCLKDWLTPF